MFRIRYNSPVILTFSLLTVAILLLDRTLWRGLAEAYFAADGHMVWGTPWEWFRRFSHVLGHASWEHLTGNLGFILLLGPLLEDRYGTAAMIFTILATALVTAAVHILFGNSLLMGASSVAFMLIVLASLSEFRAGRVPLTFVLVAAIFLWRELAFAFGAADVTSIASLVGGAVGAVLGYMAKRGRLPVGSVF